MIEREGENTHFSSAFLFGGFMKKESAFQHDLIMEIKSLYPNAVVLKTDPNYIQGFPDLLILNNDKWVALECKREHEANVQPNQEYYIWKLNTMSFAAFVYPENKEDIINAIQSTFGY